MRKRKDCFFGIHCDFHAKPKEGLVVGATLKESDIREICQTLQPDFLQIDCKGHPGYASYPSEIGNAMPHFALDPMPIWRKVTREYGIPLYVHFSGVYDAKYCAEHGDECVINASGAPTDYVRLDGTYLDTYFIPQISELVEKYDIDGVWVDGDCWAVRNDYRPETIRKFEKKLGISLNGAVPKCKGDAYFDEFTDFTREEYRNYLRYYVDRLHEKFPRLEICSNWAFSDHMPEKVCADVDFLSGDLNPNNCVNSARYAGRMLAGQGLSWDLMSWGFRFRSYQTPLGPQKHVTQLMQEAAMVIALGGAYQNYIMQYTDASPDVKNIKKCRALADFVRARQPYCFRGKIRPQAAMLIASYDRYKEMSKPFTREGMEKYLGSTALLCDSGQSLEIVMEESAEEYSKYPLIIVPEIYAGLEEETVEHLRSYVTAGGSLLLMGSKTANYFAAKGFPFQTRIYDEIPEIPNSANYDIGHNAGALAEAMPCYFSLDGEDHGVILGATVIKPSSEDYEVVGRICRSYRDDGVPFGVVMPYGAGKLGVIGANLGSQYYEGEQYQQRDLVRAMVEKLYDPLVRIESVDGILEIVALDVNGELMVQLVNASGNHSNPKIVTSRNITPTENARLSFRTAAAPKRVILQPEGKELDFEYRDGRAYFTVERVDIHSIVQFEF